MIRLSPISFLLAILFIVQCNNPKLEEVGMSYNVHKKDTCCNKEKLGSEKDSSIISLQSEITCPKCGYKKMEVLPTDVCLLSYTCKNCQNIMHPKADDCCVFCSYGNNKCPSKQ